MWTTVAAMWRKLVDSHHQTTLAQPLARFELLLSAAVGISWGPLLFHFVRHVLEWQQPLHGILLAALIVILGMIGARLPGHYYQLRAWERAGAGRVYVRWLGVRHFKRWMSHGDLMNAWLRRRVLDYRVVRPSVDSATAYAARTVEIERAHLAWGLAALAPAVYALTVGAYAFAALWILVNALTNVWPIFLQRYNRVRAERAVVRGQSKS